MRKILIAVPCMDQVPAPFAHSLATLTSWGAPDVQVSIYFNIGSLIYTSRNDLAKRAIKEEADLVMWFDSDMIFPPDTLRKLLAHIDAGADIATGLYYRRTQPYTPVVYKTMDVDEETQQAVYEELETVPAEPFEVEACGFGCVLMRTDVFMSVFSKYGNMFSPIGNVGEDIAFCWRAKTCGYKILCDPTMKLGHVGATVITEDFYKTYQKSIKSK